jgi:NADH dehydrogenase
VIWTGGLVPHPLLERAGLAPPDRWAPVHPTLQSVVNEQVFVVGDAAELASPLAKQAYHALDMGAHAARNIDRLLRGRELVPLAPSRKPMLVSFGDLETYLIGDDRALAGAALSAAKEAVYQLVMSKLDARGGVDGALSLLRRSGKGLVDLALANLGSVEALGRGLSLRVIR